MISLKSELRELTAPPRNVHFSAATDAYALQAAARPLFRESRQKGDFVTGTLYQHFSNRSRPAKVAVDLKWRTKIEHVRQRTSVDQDLQVVVCMLRVVKPCPESHSPDRCPARSAVAA
jgi:hypothetical protein